MIKNFLFYGFSQFVNDFVAEKGAGHMCRVFGAVTLCGFVTCVPMCKSIPFCQGCCSALWGKLRVWRKSVLTDSIDIFGKRNRVWVHALWAKYLNEKTR
jgi:hypothetical protein